MKAKCTRCSYVGRSKQPKYYMCGACYYLSLANAEVDRMDRIRARLAKSQASHLAYMKRRRKFMAAHPGAGVILKRGDKNSPMQHRTYDALLKRLANDIEQGAYGPEDIGVRRHDGEAN